MSAQRWYYGATVPERLRVGWHLIPSVYGYSLLYDGGLVASADDPLALVTLAATLIDGHG